MEKTLASVRFLLHNHPDCFKGEFALRLCCYRKSSTGTLVIADRGKAFVLPEVERPLLSFVSSLPSEDFDTTEGELKGHPWFIGTQFHPELKSTVIHPHPLFVSFVKAAIAFKKKPEAIERVVPAAVSLQ